VFATGRWERGGGLDGGETFLFGVRFIVSWEAVTGILLPPL